MGNDRTGWKTAAMTLGSRRLHQSVQDSIVLPALGSINPELISLLLHVAVKVDGHEPVIVDDLSNEASSLASVDGTVTNIHLVLGSCDDTPHESVRALREERARQARRQSQVACALITLLVILVVAAVLLIVKLATGWSPQGLLKQAWRSTTAVLPVPRAASGSLRPIARKPWTPLGSMTSLGPPWSAARQWLNEAELEQL